MFENDAFKLLGKITMSNKFVDDLLPMLFVPMFVMYVMSIIIKKPCFKNAQLNGEV